MAAVKFYLYFSVMFILQHVFNDFTIAFQEFDSGEFLVFCWNWQILACFADQLAMSLVIILSSDIIFDEDVNLYVGVNWKSK